MKDYIEQNRRYVDAHRRMIRRSISTGGALLLAGILAVGAQAQVFFGEEIEVELVAESQNVVISNGNDENV